MKKKKICVIVASRANYGRVKHLMLAIKKHPDLELQLIVGASTLLERFGKAVKVIENDGFKPDRAIHYVVEGETLITQAKSTGLGIVEISTALGDLNPDAVVTVADRFETMATAIASSYLNIPLVHIQGGEVSGNIDDRVRHAITKLSDLHFVATEESRDRVIKMGEHVDTVFNYGCPSIDVLKHSNLNIEQDAMDKYGHVGCEINWDKPYILMVQHPVTTSYGQGLFEVSQSLEALKKMDGYQKVVLWPNIDAGSDDVSKGIRIFRESHRDLDFAFYKNFTPEDYARVVANSACCVGNSSSFIREGAFLGIPVVIVGDRQKNRETGKNVVHSGYDTNEIFQKMKNQLAVGRYESDHVFGKGDAGVLIAQQLSEENFNLAKTITY